MNNENLIYLTKHHWIVFLKPAVFFMIAIISITLPQIDRSFRGSGHLMFLIFFPLFLYTFIKSLVHFLNSEFGITDKRIIIKTGFIKRNTLELLLPKVETISVDQSILGRILNYGTIDIRGTGGTINPYYMIPNPLEFRKIVHSHTS